MITVTMENVQVGRHSKIITSCRISFRRRFRLLNTSFARNMIHLLVFVPSRATHHPLLLQILEGMTEGRPDRKSGGEHGWKTHWNGRVLQLLLG